MNQAGPVPRTTRKQSERRMNRRADNFIIGGPGPRTSSPEFQSRPRYSCSAWPGPAWPYAFVVGHEQFDRPTRVQPAMTRPFRSGVGGAPRLRRSVACCHVEEKDEERDERCRPHRRRRSADNGAHGGSPQGEKYPAVPRRWQSPCAWCSVKEHLDRLRFDLYHAARDAPGLCRSPASETRWNRFTVCHARSSTLSVKTSGRA